MSEEMTERFNSSDSFETRVLTALAAINGQLGSINVRLTALEEKVSAIDARLTAVEQKMDAIEEKVDARLRETRPIWEGVLARLDRMDAKFDVFAREMLEMRADIVLLQKRQPPAA